MTEWDAPNQQVVRADQSAPWEEGTGGADVAPKAGDTDEPTLDEMTKAQLVSYAAAHGIEVQDEMTKAEVRAAIDEAGG